MMPRLVLLSAILLGGCTLGPDYVRPELPKADVFPEAGKGGAAIRPEWWKSLGDPELDALVAKALVANADLRIAVQQPVGKDWQGTVKIDGLGGQLRGRRLAGKADGKLLLAPVEPFHQRGQSGAWVSNFLPHIAGIADMLAAETVTIVLPLRAVWDAVVARADDGVAVVADHHIAVDVGHTDTVAAAQAVMLVGSAVAIDAAMGHAGSPRNFGIMGSCAVRREWQLP